MNSNVMYSFIVPVYNTAKYLEESINSILRQKTEYEYEIIIVNDGSTDDSLLVAEKIAKGRDEVRIISKENEGAAVARNVGTKAARGQWIIYLDSDDYIAKDYLKIIDTVISKVNYDEILVVDNLLLYEDGSTCVEEGVKALNRRTGSIINDVLPNACGKIISRKLIEDNKLYFPEKIYFEDIAWFPFLASFCSNYIWINEPLYVYRQLSNSTSHSRDIARMEYVITALEILRRNMKKNKVFHVNYIEMEFYASTFALCYMCPEIIAVDYKNDMAKKILRYIKHNYPTYESNPYIERLSKRNKVYIKLISKRKFKMLHFLISVKTKARDFINKGPLSQLYLLYRKASI